MPSIWETRSSSVLAAESHKGLSAPKEKSGKNSSSAKDPASKTSSGGRSSKESEEKKETDELNNILLPSTDGSGSPFSPGAVKAQPEAASGPVGGTLPSLADPGEPIGSDAVNGAAPSDAMVAPDADASGVTGSSTGSSRTKSSRASDDAATDGMGNLSGDPGSNYSENSSAAQDLSWPGEEESSPSSAPDVEPKDAVNPPPLSAVIEKDDGIQLKAQQALTEAEKNKKLIGEAIAKHGSCGLFLVTYMNGPWTVERTLKGSSGEAAGLKPGDTIISIDGKYTTGMKIREVYFISTGYRGQYRSFVINRDGVIKTISVPLWGILDMKDRRTQYIEYYWYLLYHNLMSVQAYNRAVAPFLYFKVPVFKPMPVLKGK